MRVYIAGKLGTEFEKTQLEKIDKLCKKHGFKTFLPHREVGICQGIEDVERVFNGDIIDGFKDCELIIALLDGLYVGAGTAWELGYAYAKNIKGLGLKTDEPIKNSLDTLSAILIGSMRIVPSFEELEIELEKIKTNRAT